MTSQRLEFILNRFINSKDEELKIKRGQPNPDYVKLKNLFSEFIQLSKV